MFSARPAGKRPAFDISAMPDDADDETHEAPVAPSIRKRARLSKTSAKAAAAAAGATAPSAMTPAVALPLPSTMSPDAVPEEAPKTSAALRVAASEAVDVDMTLVQDQVME